MSMASQQHKPASINDDGSVSELAVKSLPQFDEGIDWSSISASDWVVELARLCDSEIEPHARRFWMQVMRDWTAKQIKPTLKSSQPETIQNAFQCCSLMRTLAYTLCDWGFIIDLHHSLSAILPRSEQLLDEEQTVEYLQLSVAYWQMGMLTEAEQFLQSSQPLLSEDNPLRDFHHQITQDIDQLPVEHQQICDGDISLSPLEEQHISSFSWVYHDPKIAQLCHLPTFEDDQKWFNWLVGNQSDLNKVLFAVNHRQWGFIGSVFLAVHQGVGFFYYWLGQDFQGQGFGPQAVNLLLQLGKAHMGMTCCYAKAYKENISSHHAMKKIGFEPLPFTVAEPNENEMYFYYGADKPRQVLGQEVCQLSRQMGFIDQIMTD
jgi:RimJ/RimL family protein N-acetyltransferase